MRGVDLFCGCGGFSRGVEDAGIEIIEAYDCWPDAIECYNLNFKHPAKIADLADAQSMARRIASLKPDIIIGGPPCQDFSNAGKRHEGDRANLTESYAQIVATAVPKWFVMENVDRAQNSRSYRAARKKLSARGYGLTEIVLNARDFGVPQNRRRFFSIGLLGADDQFLTDDLLARKQDRQITVRDHFKGIGRKIDVAHYYRHPRNYSRRAVFSVDELAPTIRGVNRPVPNGYNGHDGDTHEAKKVRPLTSQERSLIQTFPPDFKFVGSKTTIEQMLGNAVPVKLAANVASSILNYNKICSMKRKPAAPLTPARESVRPPIVRDLPLLSH